MYKQNDYVMFHGEHCRVETKPTSPSGEVCFSLIVTCGQRNGELLLCHDESKLSIDPDGRELAIQEKIKEHNLILRLLSAQDRAEYLRACGGIDIETYIRNNFRF